jgi:hypothetical protein
MKTLEEKIEAKSDAHYGQKLGTPTDYTVGAQFGIKEGFQLALDYFARREEGHILFDLAQEGKRLGIFTKGEDF